MKKSVIIPASVFEAGLNIEYQWFSAGHGDRDHWVAAVAKTETFDNTFASEHIHVIHTPVRAPNANAFAERWVKTVRNECLDKLLIFNEAHLRQVLREYIAYYNTARPHEALGQQSPLPRTIPATDGPVRCRPILGGIQNDYYRDAA